MNDPIAPPPQLVLSRRLPHARELVFGAFSSAEHIQHWFGPNGFTVPEADVEFRAGGAFNIVMCAPDGKLSRIRGRFVEVTPPQRLVIDMHVYADRDVELFFAHTTLTFTAHGPQTELEVRQAYTVFDAIALPMIEGAARGWGQSLDRLGAKIAHLKAPSAAPGAVVHGSFSLTRRLKADPGEVFHALTDPRAKAKWFRGPPGYTELSRHLDARPGGREELKGRWEGGVVSTFNAVYHDVLADRRIIYSYDMLLDERKISVSLATFDLKPEAGGTLLTLTEQGAFLDGYDAAGARERGTASLLDSLVNALDG